MEDDYDEYAPISEPLAGSDEPEASLPPGAQDGPSLLDEADEVPPQAQTGPGLFGDDDNSVNPEDELGFGGASAAAADRPEAPLALYRRYRPDTFADVIGQDHVTVPLLRALENNRVNHAYLFSGPRGCGKTTSARILARCLNCEQGPTPTPCGQCQSCLDLSRGGSGSIDVIEIDAASHGGVDDARDLRERAFFAPVNSRYKVYIVDEAHMVTTAGFNALLKLVEEPPPHAKFVFATTEPDKVIGTIRSRTHHYPFRLVPPRLLSDYLSTLCEAEGVSVDPAALPLVVRAGGGSVRDSLSVLDQLLGGAGPQGVSHEQAAALLGFTPDALLDEIVDAFAAGDAAGVFRTIDRVIEIGQDPRRFAEDLLRRLRDLVILSAVPEAAENGMLEVSNDQAQRLATQVAGIGPGELTRAAEVIAVGLTQMRGTTAPRLHLELMCARVLLPEADDDERGLHARMERLERRIGMADAPESAPAPRQRPAPSEPKAASEQQASRRPQPAPAPEPPAVEPAPQAPAPEAGPPRRRPARQTPGAAVSPSPETPPAKQAAPATAALSTTELRRLWPSVLEEVNGIRRFSYMLLSQHAQVMDASGGRLRLGFSNAGARDRFLSSGSAEVLSKALVKLIGANLQIDAALQEAGGRPENTVAAAPSQPDPINDEAAQIAADDAAVTDLSESATKLVSEAFGAEIIDES